MSLTPFGSRYDSPYFGDDEFDEEFDPYPYGRYDDSLLDDDGYADVWRDYAYQINLVEEQIDQSYPSYDIPHETEMAWKQYEEEHRPNPVEDVPTPLTATEALELRLAEMAWLHTPAHRHTNPKRAAQKGRRYTTEHGSAAARKLHEAMRRERLRKARKNRHTKHYTPDWKLRARREEQKTWGDAHGDLAEIDRWGIAHGLYYLAITAGCKDPRCCPVDDDLYGYGSYGARFDAYDPYYDDDYDDPFWGAPLSFVGYRADDFDW